MNDEFLFIGGSADGRRIRVEHLHIKVPDARKFRLGGGVITEAVYRREDVYAEGHIFSVMLLNGMTVADAMQRLIDGYGGLKVDGVSPTTLVEMGHLPIALQLICDLLSVKQMGPADHIRTKHEIRDFINQRSRNGYHDAAEILKRAKERRDAEAKR